jgi:hypothetical protein
VKEKPIAYTTDVSQLIRSIWKFESNAVFKNIRAMFNGTLVLNSLVDGASRSGEFIPKDIDSVEHQRYMKWKDLVFFLVSSDDVDGVTIYIIVLCKWPNIDQKTIMNCSKLKSISNSTVIEKSSSGI